MRSRLRATDLRKIIIGKSTNYTSCRGFLARLTKMAPDGRRLQDEKSLCIRAMSVQIATPTNGKDLLSVYIRQWKVLRSLLRRRFGSHDLAEDALQETWLRLSDMKSTPAVSNPQAFILRIAGNIAIDLMRRERRHTSRCVINDTLLESIADLTPSPETSAIDRDMLFRLAVALMRLPPNPRAALLLSRCDGLPYKEIADRLQVSESMVAKYLAQALRHCRDHLHALG